MKFTHRMKCALLALLVCIAMVAAMVPSLAEDSAEPETVEVAESASNAAAAEPSEPEPASEPEPEKAEVAEPEASEATQSDDEPSEEPTQSDEPDAQPEGEDADDAEPDPEQASEQTEGDTAEAETEETAEEPTLKIVAFAPLALTEYEMNAKPTLEESLARLPEKLSVSVAAGEEAPVEAEVAVSWACPDYDATPKYGEYTFTASLAEETYPLAEGVELPVFVLKVVPLKSGDYTYELSDKQEVTLLGWTGSDKQLVIPDKLEDHDIVAIAAEVFKDKAELTRVELPKGLKTLGDSAFAGCAKLEAVVWPDALETVGKDVFKDDTALKTLILRTDLDSTLTASDTVTHKATDGEGETATEKTVTLTLPMAVTDIEVRTGTFTLDCDYTVAEAHSLQIDANATLKVLAERKLNNLGALTNNGTLTNEGSVYTCTGTYSGNEAENAEGASFITEHDYEDGVCVYCGEPEATAGKTVLDIRYTGDPLTKVYDKTHNVTLKSSDFTLSGIAEGHKVKITKLTAAYDSPNVGSRTVKVSFKLGGDDGDLYTAKAMSISATITPKVLTITPTEGQTKVYGAADPAYLSGKVKGLLERDTISGRLSREPGENVGRYKITVGSISGGDNYTVDLLEEYFTITAKPISDANVSFAAIGNQRYTGVAVKPELDLRLGNLKLKQGRDYTAEYSDNVETGTASVKVTGIGNFSGTRTATFRILKVSSSFTSTSRSTGTGYNGYSYDGFDDTTDDEVYDSEADEALIGNLIIDDVDYGTVLFDADGAPQPFYQYEEAVDDEVDPEADAFDQAPEELRLVIQPEPLYDEETGETIYTEDDRETYGDLHLRITPEQVRMLLAENYTELVYEVEYAQLHIPLAALNGEYEIIEEPEQVEEADEGAVEMPEQDIEAAEGVMPVKVYDICIAQALEDRMTLREAVALDDAEAEDLVLPYRVTVTAEVSEDAESDITADWPALDQLEGVRLNVMVMDDYEEAPEDSTLVAVLSDPELSDEEAVQTAPAEYVWQDEILYAEIVPTADGLYVVRGAASEADEEL